MHCGEKPEGAMDKSIGRGLHLCVLAFVLYPSRLAKFDREKGFFCYMFKVAFEIREQFLLYARSGIPAKRLVVQ